MKTRYESTNESTFSPLANTLFDGVGKVTGYVAKLALLLGFLLGVGVGALLMWLWMR